MQKLKKFRNNIFNARALEALGPALYARYIAGFAITLPEIARVGNLRPLDAYMGRYAQTFRYRGRSFVYDCGANDALLPDTPSFAFGIAREIFIRDCYFVWQPPDVFDRARTVVDLGANRGTVSTLMTLTADRIVCVECLEQYQRVIAQNMEANGFDDWSLETAFIGEGGLFEGDHERISMDELYERHGLEHVDFMKMDIEGSEFALFAEPDWLERVGALSMEVHSDEGDPSEIVGALSKHGFTTVLADEDLRRVGRLEQPGFLYAWKEA